MSLVPRSGTTPPPPTPPRSPSKWVPPTPPPVPTVKTNCHPACTRSQSHVDDELAIRSQRKRRRRSPIREYVEEFESLRTQNTDRPLGGFIHDSDLGFGYCYATEDRVPTERDLSAVMNIIHGKLCEVARGGKVIFRASLLVTEVGSSDPRYRFCPVDKTSLIFHVFVAPTASSVLDQSKKVDRLRMCKKLLESPQVQGDWRLFAIPTIEFHVIYL